MTTEIEKLTAQMEANKTRREKRKKANDKDWEEFCLLMQQMERATARTLKGQTVVLNPNSSISHPELRKLRGMTAIVESIGTKYIRVVFANNDIWRVRFGAVVLATPDNVSSRDGDMLDSLATTVNAALTSK